MECRECSREIDKNDNFCGNCGTLTIKGYSFLKDEKNIDVIDGEAKKKTDRMGILFVIAVICLFVFIVLGFIRGDDLFRPYIYLKKELFYQKNGYKSSVIITDNQYNKIIVSSLDDAYSLIVKDLESRKWQCDRHDELYKLEEDLINNYHINVVNFCDISIHRVQELVKVIESVFDLFPNTSGYLTNISISNTYDLDEYVASFQPINQFVNSSEDINKYNKVNKTQILLNSYYFLNENMVKEAKDNWYPSGATWESLIAHELGHYLLFVALLKEENVENITFVTKDNFNEFMRILLLSDNGDLASRMINIALDNYNSKYETKIDIEEFAGNISEYAIIKNNKKIIFEETIAEAVHDYYLNRESASRSTLEIINVLKMKLE